MVHGLAAIGIPDFQKSSFSPTPPAPGEGVTAPFPRTDTQADFFMASLIRSAALDAASCRVAVERCE